MKSYSHKSIIFNRYNLNKKKKKNIKKKSILVLLFLFIIIIIINIIKTKKPPLKKQIKICLCSIGKEENLYVKEFVSHYKKIGYNNIFIYDNNDINGEKFEDALYNEVNEGFVSIINYRGCKKCQLKSYYDCYKNNYLKYNWLSFFDMDELLEFNSPNLKAQEFFENEKFNKCMNVKINWVFYYNDSDVLFYEDRPFQERFKNFTEHKYIKSTVRGNLSYNYWSRAIGPHNSLNNFTACSSSGKIVDFKSHFIQPPDIKNARLKHYHRKSFEEFCIKVKRGKPIYMPKYKTVFETLFKKNKDNKEKMKIIKKIFGINFNQYNK